VMYAVEQDREESCDRSILAAQFANRCAICFRSDCAAPLTRTSGEGTAGVEALRLRHGRSLGLAVMFRLDCDADRPLVRPLPRWLNRPVWPGAYGLDQSHCEIEAGRLAKKGAACRRWM